MSTDYKRARRNAVGIKAHLAAGGRASRRLAVELCDEVERLADFLTVTEEQRARQPHFEATLLEYNAICQGLRERFGLHITSREGQTWDWRWGREEGSAPTIARAILAGLAAAGAKRAPSPPLDQQLRQAGAEELPGFAAEQLQRHEE